MQNFSYCYRDIAQELSSVAAAFITFALNAFLLLHSISAYYGALQKWNLFLLVEEVHTAPPSGEVVCVLQ